jgi:hypothetical protein
LNLSDHLLLLLTPGYVKAATATEKHIRIGIERVREVITTKYQHKTQGIKQNRTNQTNQKKKPEKYSQSETTKLFYYRGNKQTNKLAL